MKKISLLFIVAIACAFTACSTADNSDAEGDTAADTMKTRVDTANRTISTMPDSVFANAAAISGLVEIDLGKLAIKKSSNSKIKAVAAIMVKDRRIAHDELKAIAKTKAFMLPTVLDARHLAKKDSLSQLSRVIFDQAFVMTMIKEHQKMLKLMQDEAANGKDADLMAFAAKTAGTLQMQLDEVNMIHLRIK